MASYQEDSKPTARPSLLQNDDGETDRATGNHAQSPQDQSPQDLTSRLSPVADAMADLSRTRTAEAAPPLAEISMNAQQLYRSPVVQERENFLLFIKILFKILEDAHEPDVKSKAQRIVMDCKRRSQQGDPNFSPLMDALERRLRGFVGELKWRRAHLFLSHYIEKRRNAPSNLSSIRPQATALTSS
jgi:hypothetical protein